MLSKYGRRLAAGQALAQREKPRRKDRRESEATMTEMTILKHGVQYVDGGPIQRPERGDVVSISSPSVVRTLVKTGRACEGRSMLDHMESATAAPGPPREPVQGSGADDTGAAENGSETASWDDVTGISKSSLALLKKNAPHANPLTATPEELLVWLDNSSRRTQHAVAGLEKWRAARGGGSDGDG